MTPSPAHRRIINTLAQGGIVVANIETCGAWRYTKEGRTIGTCTARTIAECRAAGWIEDTDETNESAYKLPTCEGRGQ